MTLPHAPNRHELRNTQSGENVGLLDMLDVLHDSKWLIAGLIAGAPAGAAAHVLLVIFLSHAWRRA